MLSSNSTTSSPPLRAPKDLPPANEPVESLQKALCIALQYSSRKSSGIELHDARGDAAIMKKLLVGAFNYRKDDVRVMTDDTSGIPPTRANIIRAIRNLVRGAIEGDRFFFHFSGLVSQVVIADDNESDQTHDVLWPLDVEYDPASGEVKNVISDTEIQAILINSLPPNAHCTMVFDCGSLSYPPESDQLATTSRPQNRRLISVGNVVRSLGSQAFAGLPTVEYNSHPGMSYLPDNLNSTPLLRSDVDVTSWSVCLDQRSTLQKRGPGLFVMAIQKCLGDNLSPTRAELLIAITDFLEENILLANMRKPRDHKPFTYLRPQLGSTRDLDAVLTEEFVM